jgi:SAM-dependent methyltransferase
MNDTLCDVVAGQCCPLCGGSGMPMGHTLSGHLIRVCCNCNLSLSWQWQSVEEYESLYTISQIYHATQQKEEGQQDYWQRDMDAIRAAHARVQILLALFPQTAGKYLVDVGTATGAFPAVACGYGYMACGIEPNRMMVQRAHDLGREFVHCNDWRGLFRSDMNVVEVITLHDVFEHLVRPWDCLTHLHTILKPEGVLVIEMPEWNCFLQRAAGINWKHIRPLQHVCLYSEEAARRLFGCTGFRTVHVTRPLGGNLGKISYYLQKNDTQAKGGVVKMQAAQEIWSGDMVTVGDDGRVKPMTLSDAVNKARGGPPPPPTRIGFA